MERFRLNPRAFLFLAFALVALPRLSAQNSLNPDLMGTWQVEDRGDTGYFHFTEDGHWILIRNGDTTGGRSFLAANGYPCDFRYSLRTDTIPHQLALSVYLEGSEHLISNLDWRVLALSQSEMTIEWINRPSRNGQRSVGEAPKLVRKVAAVLPSTEGLISKAYPKVNKQWSGDPRKDLFELFPTGTVSATLIENIAASPEKIELMNRAMGVFAQAPEWAFSDTVPLNNPRALEAIRKGAEFTEQELSDFREFMENKGSIWMLPSDTATIHVRHDGMRITLMSDGRLDILDGMEIDVSDLTILWNGEICTLRDTINILSAENALHTPWRGYEWQFALGTDGISSVEDVVGRRIRLYTVTVGLLERNQKTFVEISAVEMGEDLKVFKYKIPFVFGP